MSTTELLEQLQSGNQRFTSNQSTNHHIPNEADLETMAEGQSPYAIILSCADSRVVPEFIFDAGLGELFVIRVAGNIANQSSIASIEYAVAHLHTKLIVVMGHQNCGAVTAAIQQVDGGKNINHLIDHIEPVLHLCDDQKNTAEVVQKNAQYVATDLLKKSEIISKAVDDEQLSIRSAYYHLDSGQVSFLD